jgi:hypothetical protein
MALWAARGASSGVAKTLARAWLGVEGASERPSAMVARDDAKMTTTPKDDDGAKRKSQGERKGNAC